MMLQSLDKPIHPQTDKSLERSTCVKIINSIEMHSGDDDILFDDERGVHRLLTRSFSRRGD